MQRKHSGTTAGKRGPGLRLAKITAAAITLKRPHSTCLHTKKHAPRILIRLWSMRIVLRIVLRRVFLAASQLIELVQSLQSHEYKSSVLLVPWRDVWAVSGSVAPRWHRQILHTSFLCFQSTDSRNEK